MTNVTRYRARSRQEHGFVTQTVQTRLRAALRRGLALRPRDDDLEFTQSDYNRLIGAAIVYYASILGLCLWALLSR